MSNTTTTNIIDAELIQDLKALAAKQAEDRRTLAHNAAWIDWDAAEERARARIARAGR